MKTLKKDSPSVDDESILGRSGCFGNYFRRERLAGLKETSLDAICVQTQSGGCGSWIDILPRILLRFGMDEAVAISSQQA